MWFLLFTHVMVFGGSVHAVQTARDTEQACHALAADYRATVAESAYAYSYSCTLK